MSAAAAINGTKVGTLRAATPLAKIPLLSSLGRSKTENLFTFYLIMFNMLLYGPKVD